METIKIILNTAGAVGGFWAAYIVARTYVRANPRDRYVNAMYLLMLLSALLTSFRRLYVIWKPAELQFWFWFITPVIIASCWVWVQVQIRNGLVSKSGKLSDLQNPEKDGTTTH